MLARLRQLVEWSGRLGPTFVVALALYVALAWLAPNSGWRVLAEFLSLVLFVWLFLRVVRLTARQIIWRLRNRLLVTYAFIAVVPIVLIAMLVGLGGWSLASQLAVYLVTSELDRRIEGLKSAAESLVRTEPRFRPAVMERMMELFYRERYPGIEMVLRESGNLYRYPPESALTPPPDGWEPTHGVLLKEGRFWAWAYKKTASGDITVLAPLTRAFLASLVPNLGLVDFSESLAAGSPRGSGVRFRSGNRDVDIHLAGRLPPPANRFDREVGWLAAVPTANWDTPGVFSDDFILLVRSRVSAVLGTVLSSRADSAQGLLQIALLAVAVLFLIVEIISLVIGISMTRTITSAVHHLYDGTQKVIEGDFSHRIEVKGKDQLAALSHSFNRMTENLERLLAVAKEKERLQSEIEIAREVQSQLYPRSVPEMRTLHIHAMCQPARMVSGDYYDYELIRDGKVALAIGDVAGKGISAALLMATLQASLRTQLQNSLEMAAAAGNGRSAPALSTAHLVSRLNAQLHAYTSAEKYSTFFLGVYDEATALLRYTNAGHLPPILVRDGGPKRLDVNGTVVGAFPFSLYDESSVDLQPGDLLVCFTDGITEPENEYGEMFGEDRLIDLVAKNAHRSDAQIIGTVMESVQQWTASPELQDDMTLLLARRV